MSKSSHRPGREDIKEIKRKKAQQRRWREQQIEAGLKPHGAPTPSNCKSRFDSQEEEPCARHEAVTGLVQLMRLAHLFNTLARFSKELAGLFAELAVRAAIGFIRNTLTGPMAGSPGRRAAIEPPLPITIGLPAFHPQFFDHLRGRRRTSILQSSKSTEFNLALASDNAVEWSCLERFRLITIELTVF
jgi:hypothetical protein